MSRYDELPPQDGYNQAPMSMADQIDQEVFGGQSWADAKAGDAHASEADDFAQAHEGQFETSATTPEAGYDSAEEERRMTIRQRLGAVAMGVRGAWDRFEENNPDMAGRVRTVGGAAAETGLVFVGEAAKAAIALKSRPAAKAVGVVIDHQIGKLSDANEKAAKQRGEQDLREEAIFHSREQVDRAAEHLATRGKKAAV